MLHTVTTHQFLPITKTSQYLLHTYPGLLGGLLRLGTLLEGGLRQLLVLALLGLGGDLRALQRQRILCEKDNTHTSGSPYFGSMRYSRAASGPGTVYTRNETVF